MRNLPKFLLFTVILLQLIMISCGSSKTDTGKTGTEAIPVIFETDMGNDVDDAIALDMLYKYLDQGKINLLGISTNKDNPYSIPFLQIMDNWYGYADIPLGKVKDGVNSTADAKDYAQSTYDFQQNGEYAFRKYAGDTSKVMESVALYRKLLAGHGGNDIRIVSVGFSTNLARLLNSAPDSISPLSGTELIKQKVQGLYLMAGNFDGSVKDGEYNIIRDSLAAKEVFEKWPTPIVTSPFEVGIKVLYPATGIQNDLNWVEAHPLKVAYESYLQMPYDRPSWDPTALLYAVEGSDGYFGVSEPGRITVVEAGHTRFTADKDGSRRYLTIDSLQAEKARDRIVELIKTKPLHHH